MCELAPDDDGLVVLLGDRRLRLPRWLTSAMERIAGTDMLRLGDLADVVPDATSRAVLARRLVREGLLTTARIDRADAV